MSANRTIREGRGSVRRFVDPAMSDHFPDSDDSNDADFAALDQLGQWLDGCSIPGGIASADSTTALQCLGRVTLQHREGIGDADCGFTSGAIQLGRVNVLACRTRAEVTLMMQESSQRYLFWMPISGSIEMADRESAGARKIGRGRIGIVPALAHVRSTLSPDARLLAVVVPQSALLSGIEALAGAPVNGHVTFDDRALPLGSPVGTMILRLLQLLKPICMERGLSYSLPPFVRQIESMMVLSIISALPHNFTQKAVSEEAHSVAPAVVSLAESYMQKNAAEPIGLDDIAAATGYGARTLQLAFRKFRQTTPVSQLRRIRLELIHQELCHPDKDTTVAGAARAWQFPSTGRMSNRFRQIYGETPEQVLRRGRRNAGLRKKPMLKKY